MITLATDVFWISPYVFTCAVTLREKNLAFDHTLVSLGDGAQLRPDYKAKSVTARVPSLDHDGFVVAESTAIVEYLEDAFPAPKHPRVLPAGIQERARARQILSWIRSDDTLALRDERPTSTMFYERANKPLEERGLRAAKKLVEVTERLVGSGRTTLFDGWCIADADLAFMLHRLLLNGHDLPAPVKAYATANWNRPSVREFVERKRPAFVPY